ncbi:EAL domain-containing protein [Nocardioides terrae]|nr:EAL domain-containing protein [Nocardioides terrae]
MGEHGTRLYASFAQCDRVGATAAIIVALLGAWIGSLLLGGSQSPAPHLFYVPIALAAVRFGTAGALPATAAAGVLAGPLLPTDVDAMAPQSPGEWLLRSAIFMAVGLFIASLADGDHGTIRSRLQDAAVSARLSRAMRSGAIEVFYQPIFRVGDGALESVEALVRWRRPDGHYVSPASFVPAAERTGVIGRIDRFVLTRAVSAARELADAGRPVSISVNFSAVTLARPALEQSVRHLLETHDLDPRFLQVEITESALVDDLTTVVRHVEALRTLGVRIAIDDFGAGHASLNYLQHFPADVVKLDRTFLTTAADDGRSRRLLEGVVDMCARLHMAVVAEGVESTDQLALIREANVSLVQGFLLGRPGPLQELRASLDLPDRRPSQHDPST